ncbi:hypothetical protein BDV93DRAFT_527785 [Ceratobasidium sp. AG-I]|nr:hypothetical protein BDV93DRAFT_527785 [Ceratobasidium sp. AG-I]
MNYLTSIYSASTNHPTSPSAEQWWTTFQLANTMECSLRRRVHNPVVSLIPFLQLPDALLALL